MYTWKYHKETPCITTLNKQKCHFVFYKNVEQESRTDPAQEFGTTGSGEDLGTGYRRENIVPILCTCV
jgi:hypothetical protein